MLVLTFELTAPKIENYKLVSEVIPIQLMIAIHFWLFLAYAHSTNPSVLVFSTRR